MATKITKNFNVHNARQFVESLDEQANSLYYVTAGRHLPWANASSPTVPSDSLEDTYYNIYDNMSFGKKVNVADVVGSSILKSEKQTRTEDSKGVNSKYQTIEENKILETTLNNYKVVFTKTFKQGNKFRTYTVIKYATKT